MHNESWKESITNVKTLEELPFFRFSLCVSPFPVVSQPKKLYTYIFVCNLYICDDFIVLLGLGEKSQDVRHYFLLYTCIYE